jgi:hypothetical protein
MQVTEESHSPLQRHWCKGALKRGPECLTQQRKLDSGPIAIQRSGIVGAGEGEGAGEVEVAGEGAGAGAVEVAVEVAGEVEVEVAGEVEVEGAVAGEGVRL